MFNTKKEISFIDKVKHITSQSKMNAVSNQKGITASIDDYLAKHVDTLKHKYIEHCKRKIEQTASLHISSAVCGRFIDNSTPLDIEAENVNQLKHIIDKLSLFDLVSANGRPRPLNIDYMGYSEIQYNCELLPTIDIILTWIKDDKDLSKFKVSSHSGMVKGGFGKLITFDWSD